MNKDIKIIAHRGGAGMGGTENTLDAFENAIQLGVDMVEFDVRKTLDNKLVVYHDSQIEGRAISETSYEELQSIAEKNGFRIPTFLEVIKLCHNRVFMDIEIKETGYEYRIVKIVNKLLDYNEYSIKSFFYITFFQIKKWSICCKFLFEITQ